MDATDRHDHTPPHLAVLRRKGKCVNSLITAGANIHAVNKEGFTPLHSTALHGHIACIDLLIEAAADLMLKVREIRPLHHYV